MKLEAGYEVSPQSEYYEDQAVFGISVVYPVACMFPKLSMALTFYPRIFTQAATYRFARWTSLSLIIVLASNSIAFLVPSVLVHYRYGISRYLLGTWINIPHIVTDLIMLALSVPMVHRLRMPKVKKAALMLVFMAGGM